MNTGQFGFLAAAALVVFLPLAVSAQQIPPSGTTQPPTERMEPSVGMTGTESSPATTQAPTAQSLSGQDVASAINSDDLIGKSIKDNANETVGAIDALLVSKDSRVVGVVLDVGGFLGIGGRKVVVPMNQLSIAGSDIRMLNISKEQLQRAPAYEKPKS